MTSRDLASNLGEHPCRVRPPSSGGIIYFFATGVMGLLGVGLLIAAIANIRQPALALGILIGAGLILVGAELLRRAGRPDRKDPLTLVVGSGGVGFEREGVVAAVPRSEVGVVVLEGAGEAGIVAVTVLGPTGDVVGRWETGWVCGNAIRSWRALQRHGWPAAIEEMGRVRKVSDDAPAWVRERGR